MKDRRDIWYFDAHDIDFNQFNRESLLSHITINNEIREFLDEKPSTRIIVSPKGIGKTHLIKIKSALIRNEEVGYKYLPKKDLVEMLGPIDFSGISNRARSILNNVGDWNSFFQLCLYLYINSNEKYEIDDELKKITGGSTGLGRIIYSLLYEIDSSEKYYYLINKSRILVENIKNNFSEDRLILFIDNLDESLMALKRSIENWCNAQIGFLMACLAVTKEINKIKIYSCIRSEPFYYQNEETIRQYQSYIVKLEYNKEFINRIIKDRLKKYEGNIESLEILFKINEIPHLTVLDNTLKNKKEKIFDYLYRHTFGRPREILQLIYEIVGMESISIQNIRQKVHVEAKGILKQRIAENINSIKLEVYHQIFQCFYNNICSNTQISKIQITLDNIQIPNGIDILYSSGFLGVVVKSVKDNEYIQEFKEISKFSLDKITIPNSDYYLLHPCTFSYIKDEIGFNAGFIDDVNIVGHNLPFYREHSSLEKNLHVHYGDNIISLGVVIPETLKYKNAIIVFNKMSTPYFIDTTIKEIEYNIVCKEYSEIYNLEVVNDNDIHFDYERTLQKVKSGKKLILITDNQKSIISILKSCTTFSFTKYDKFLFDIFKNSKNLNIKVIYKVVNYKTSRNNRNLSKIGSLIKVKTELAYGNCIIKEHIVFNINKFTIKVGYRHLAILHQEWMELPKSNIIERPSSYKELKYFNLRNKYFDEGAYQFYKVVDNYNKRNEFIHLFLSIQFSRFRRELKNDYLIRRLLNNSPSIERAFAELETFSNRLIEEYDEAKTDKNVSQARLEHYKKEGVLPDHKDIISFIYERPVVDFQLLHKIKNILGIQPVHNEGLFISYSSSNDKIASIINSVFFCFGYERFYFPESILAGDLRGYLKKEIYKNDVFVFLATEESFRSLPCQREVRYVRKKHLDLTRNVKIFCFDIDGTLHNNSKINEIKEYWLNEKFIEFEENYNFLKEYISTDIKNIINNTNKIEFKKFWIEFITKNLLK